MRIITSTQGNHRNGDDQDCDYDANDRDSRGRQIGVGVLLRKSELRGDLIPEVYEFALRGCGVLIGSLRRGEVRVLTRGRRIAAL